MTPLVVLVALFVILSLVGRLEAPFTLGWWTSLRVALAGMFFLTASAHWGKRRPDLVRMVPSVCPKPEFLVTLTGILETVGALGLIYPPTARAAAACLCVLLLCLFPANVRAAREKMTIAGRPVPPLLPRAAIQLVFIAASLAIVFGEA